MCVRDFKAQNRKSILGYLWTIITPVAAAASYILLNSVGVLQPGQTDVPYPLYVFVGFSIWNLFVATTTSVGNGLSSQGDLLLKTNIPKLPLAIIATAQVVYNLVVQIIIAILLLILTVGKFNPVTLIAFFPSVIPILTLGISIGLVLSIVSSISRDFTGVIQIGLSLFMFFTPIIFTMPSIENSWVKPFVAFNPLTYLLIVPRSIILSIPVQSLPGYLASSLLVVVVFAMAVHFFYSVEHLVAERI